MFAHKVTDMRSVAVLKVSRLGVKSLALVGCINVMALNIAHADATAPASSTQNPSVYVENTSSAASPLLTDRFNVTLGGYVVGTNVTADLNGHSVSAGTPVDFGHTFGTDANFNRIRLDAVWRITPTQHIKLLYFNTNVTRTRTLDKDIGWGDYTFLANASVSATTKLAVYELSYEYAFLRRPTFELTGSAGIHVLDMSLKLAGDATITDANGNVSSAQYSSKNSNLPAPLPVFGVRALWAVLPNLYLDANAQIFKFSYEGYDGNWSDLRLAGTWMFTRHFGAGLGYDRFHVNVDVSKSVFNGNVTLGYSGLQAFLTGSF